MIDHVKQCVLGGEGNVLALVPAVLGYADARRGEEPARDGQLRGGEVVVPEELQVPNPPSLSFALANLKAQVNPRAHLERRTTSLAIPLSIVDIAGRDETPLGVHR